MKYFIDTEFIEGFHKPLFGKRRHFIDLISIGIVCEDGREYYAISNEFNERDADNWVKENVISTLPLPPEKVSFYDSPRLKSESLLWKDNRTIKKEILNFFGYTIMERHPKTGQVVDMSADENIQVYGYFADYDWVLFCSLFGRMIDLPYSFPMYCIDLKQIFDEKQVSLNEKSKKDNIEWNLKDHEDYPKQTNEHNALSDAEWNMRLYEFLQSLD